MAETKKVLVVKIGNDVRPANAEDIKQMQDDLEKVIKGENDILITHHAVFFEYVELPMNGSVEIKPNA